MRILIIALLFSFTTQAQSWEFKQDKQLHAGVGAVMGASLTQLMISSDRGYTTFDVIVAPQLLVNFVAMGKEAYDAFFGSGYAEIQDVAYTVMGGLVGSTITWGVNKLITNRKDKKELKL